MLDLKKLLEGAVPSIDFSLSFEDCGFVDNAVSGVAKAHGVINNHSGVILLDGIVKPDLNVSCARCGREFNYSVPFELKAKITDKLANEDEEEFVLLTDNLLDIEELVRSALILELPTRYLCKDDCKGLCSKCGCDLNKGNCNCDLTERDSRWDVLKDYLSD